MSMDVFTVVVVERAWLVANAIETIARVIFMVTLLLI
jgi:hypothetical protein